MNSTKPNTSMPPERKSCVSGWVLARSEEVLLLLLLLLLLVVIIVTVI